MNISIVVPVYNVESYLEKCIHSVLEQNFNGTYEVICVNDGSTDQSKEILNNYEQYEEIIVINQVNKGLSNARNTGLMQARGDYVMFLDSDDFLKHNQVLEKLYSEVKEHSLDFVIADFEYNFEDSTKNYKIHRNSIIKNRIMTGRELYDLGVKKKSIMSIVWNKLYSREFLLKNNLFFLEGILYEDMEFTPRVFYLANRVKLIDDVIIMYTQRAGSIMSNKTNINLDDYYKIADSISLFNESYKSKVLLNCEVYIYILITKKLKNIDDREFRINYRRELIKRGIFKKLIRSSKVKYKLFGIVLFPLFLLHLN